MSDLGLHYLPLSHKKDFRPSSKKILTVPRRCFFYKSFLLFVFRVCHAVLSVHCSLVVTCLERAGLLALLYVMFSYVFVTFPSGILGLDVLITDFCPFSYFNIHVASTKLA